MLQVQITDMVIYLLSVRTNYRQYAHFTVWSIYLLQCVTDHMFFLLTACSVYCVTNFIHAARSLLFRRSTYRRHDHFTHCVTCLLTARCNCIDCKVQLPTTLLLTDCTANLLVQRLIYWLSERRIYWLSERWIYWLLAIWCSQLMLWQPDPPVTQCQSVYHR